MSEKRTTASDIVGMSAAGRLWLLTVFLGPALVIYTLFSIYPLIATIIHSAYRPDQAGHLNYAGLANFRLLLGDEAFSVPFWNALKNNTLFFAVHMLVQNPVGIGLAALLSLPKLAFRSTYRTLIFMPTMLSVVIIGFIWQLILSPIWGISEGFLSIIGLKSWFQPWLGMEGSALITLALISVWQFVGIPMILIYAALLAIPAELTDAATVDGLNQARVFFFVKLPLVLPTVGLVSILTFVNNFNAFDLIYSVKGALAGPNFSSDILGTLFYRVFFGNQLQVGDPSMGATVATMMFLIILLGVCLYLFLVQRRIQRYSF